MAEQAELRDQFAMAAMQGDWASSLGQFDDDGNREHLEDRARLYYRMADACLEVRKKARGIVLPFKPKDEPPERT